MGRSAARWVGMIIETVGGSCCLCFVSAAAFLFGVCISFPIGGLGKKGPQLWEGCLTYFGLGDQPTGLCKPLPEKEKAKALESRLWLGAGKGPPLLCKFGLLPSL